jgi:hypothetical protein
MRAAASLVTFGCGDSSGIRCAKPVGMGSASDTTCSTRFFFRPRRGCLRFRVLMRLAPRLAVAAASAARSASLAGVGRQRRAPWLSVPPCTVHHSTRAIRRLSGVLRRHLQVGEPLHPLRSDRGLGVVRAWLERRPRLLDRRHLWRLRRLRRQWVHLQRDRRFGVGVCRVRVLLLRSERRVGRSGLHDRGVLQRFGVHLLLLLELLLCGLEHRLGLGVLLPLLNPVRRRRSFEPCPDGAFDRGLCDIRRQSQVSRDPRHRDIAGLFTSEPRLTLQERGVIRLVLGGHHRAGAGLNPDIVDPGEVFARPPLFLVRCVLTRELHQLRRREVRLGDLALDAPAARECGVQLLLNPGQ